MKLTFAILILLTIIADFAWADEGVDIANPNQVSELIALQERLDTVLTAVMGCMNSGKEHSACLCANKELIIRFNTSVKILFSNHPGLENHDAASIYARLLNSFFSLLFTHENTSLA